MNLIKSLPAVHSAVLEYAAAGYIVTPLTGKIPGKNWQKSQYELEPDLTRFPQNFGVVLTEEDLVIDLDPRNFKEGDKPFSRLCEAIGVNLKTLGCPVVRTGGGGFHLYFKLPKGLKVREMHPEYPGVEFKSKGRQVVGYACTHPDTGKTYDLTGGSLLSVPMAPDALIKLISRAKKVKNEIQVQNIPADDSQMTQDRYIQYLKTAPAAVQGQSGDNTTFSVACKAKTYGLSPEAALALLLEHYNPKCQPPWSAEELEIKVKNAYAYASGSAGQDHPAADFTTVPQAAGEYRLRWDYAENGQTKNTLNNCVNYFFLKDSELLDMLAYNEFTDQIIMTRKAPWIKESIHPSGKVWSDEDTVMCRYYLSQNYKFDISRMIVDEAVLVVAKRNPNHPVRNWMESLAWDGKKRLDSWLIDYLSAKDTPYTRTIGAKTLIGAVNRIMEPGCQFDYMLVLEGEQGTGKSTVCKILGGPWYGDIVLDPHSKDTVTAMQKCMILEVSEMQHNSRAAVDAVKSFITRKVDIIRAAYARHTREIPRQSIMIGTMNLEAESGWIKDGTGGRRFWGVETGTIDIPGFRLVRDQLFAEAVARFKKGERPYLDQASIVAEAKKEQHSRRQIDPWTEKVEDWLDHDDFGRAREIVTSLEIWTDCLNGLEKQLTRREQCRIANVMQYELKWDKGFFYHPLKKRTVAGFRRPEL